MDIRPITQRDLVEVSEIDGTIESTQYLHLERTGEGISIAWQLENRPTRTKVVESNRMDDQTLLSLRQIVSGLDDGIAIVAEHDGRAQALLLAQVRPERQTLELLDLRVDYDYRRQGIGLVMLYRAIQEARDRGLRAMMATSRTNNVPAACLLSKAGFDLAGLDAHYCSNHDLVKEAVTLFWYADLK